MCMHTNAQVRTRGGDGLGAGNPALGAGTAGTTGGDARQAPEGWGGLAHKSAGSDRQGSARTCMRYLAINTPWEVSTGVRINWGRVLMTPFTPQD